jgi:acyl carrier protein
MTQPLPIRAAELSELSRDDCRDVLEDLLVAEFKRVLLMPEDEQLSLDTSYFDIGLTSLRLTEIRQQLEDALDISIDATVLFNRPTIEDLLAYLTDRLSADAVAANSGPGG